MSICHCVESVSLKSLFSSKSKKTKNNFLLQIATLFLVQQQICCSLLDVSFVQDMAHNQLSGQTRPVPRDESKSDDAEFSPIALKKAKYAISRQFMVQKLFWRRME